MLQLEIFSQNKQLQNDQQNTEKDGELTKCKRKIQAQHIWNR